MQPMEERDNKLLELRVVTPNRHLHDLLRAKEEFEKRFPHINVIIEQVADNFSVVKGLEADPKPDIVHLMGFNQDTLNEYCIDHVSLLQEDEEMERAVYEGVLRVAKFGDRLHAMPVEVTPPLILFNKPIFDREGIAYPTDDWTWDEFAALANRLAYDASETANRQYGLLLNSDIENFEPFVMRNRGRFLSPDGSTANGYLNGPRTIEVLERLIALYRSGGAVTTLQQGGGIRSDEEETNCAMMFQFAWSVGQLREQGRLDQFGCVGLPRFGGGVEANMLYMDAIGITKSSSNPRLAWAFLRQFIFDSPQRFSEPWDLPITTTLAERTGMADDPLWGRFLQELRFAQKSGFYLNNNWNSARQLINHDIQNLIAGEAEVKKVIVKWLAYV